MSRNKMCRDYELDQELLTEMIVYLLRVGYMPDEMHRSYLRTWRKRVIEGIRVAREAWEPKRWSFYCDMPLATGSLEFFHLGQP